MILDTFNEFLKSRMEFKAIKKRRFWESAKNLESIYSNMYDKYFDEFIKDKSSHESVPNWKIKSEDITPGYLAKLRFMIYDKLMYSKIIPYILKECKNGGIVNALGIAHSGQLGHNISLLFWNQGDILQCGIYDPMYFVRNEDDPTLTYNIPLASIYVTLKIISKEYGFNINIINLSNFCYNAGKGISCLQYYMNAEYCSIYSIYFFLMLAKRDFDCDITSLRATIMDTYIVPPGNLTRHIDNLQYTTKFKLVTMSFILTVLTLVSNKNDILKDINHISKEYNIPILAPTIKELLDQKLRDTENIEKKGGYHKSRKHRRLYRRTHKR